MSEQHDPASPAAPPHPFAAPAQAGAKQQGSRSQQRWLIWTAAALIAVLFTGVVAWYVVSQAGSSSDAATSADAPDSVGGAAEDTDGTESAERSTTAWPRNMATGGIVFGTDGGDTPVVVESAAQPAGSELPAEPDDGHRVVVYLDYRCPYCSQFEQTNQSTLKDVAVSGQAEVEIRALTFLDRYSAGTEYSTRAAAGMACLADAQPEAAWNTSSALLDPDFQPEENTEGPDDAALLKFFEEASGGLNDAAKSCITEGTFTSFVQFRNEWSLSHTVPDVNDSSLGVTGTPLVLVDGEPYFGQLDDPDAFAEFLKKQGIISASSTSGA